MSVFADLGFQPPALALAMIAAATTRVRIGAACQNPLLTHPVEIAGQVAALALASGGRAYVGLARGAWLDGLGVDASRPLARLADSAEIIRRLLAGDDGGYEGTVLGLPPGVRLQFPLPEDPVDLLVGTWGRRTAKWAGEAAEEVKIGGSANPDMATTMRGWLGDSPTRVVVGAVTVCDPDREVARALARREVALYLDVVAGLDPTVTVPDDVRHRIGAEVSAGDHDAAGRAVPTTCSTASPSPAPRRTSRTRSRRSSTRAPTGSSSAPHTESTPSRGCACSAPRCCRGCAGGRRDDDTRPGRRHRTRLGLGRRRPLRRRPGSHRPPGRHRRRSRPPGSLPRLSPDDYDDRAAAARTARTALGDRATGTVDGADGALRLVLGERLDSDIDLVECGFTERLLAPLATPVDAIRSTFDHLPRESDDDWLTVLDALERVGQAHTDYLATLARSADRGHVVAARQVSGIATRCRGWVQDDFYGRLVADAPDRLADRARSAAASAARATGAFAEDVERRLLPVARVEDAVGVRLYTSTARAFLGRDVDLHETYDWGWSELDRIADEAEALATALHPDGFDAAVRMLDADPARSLPTGDIEPWLSGGWPGWQTTSTVATSTSRPRRTRSRSAG